MTNSHKHTTMTNSHKHKPGLKYPVLRHQEEQLIKLYNHISMTHSNNYRYNTLKGGYIRGYDDTPGGLEGLRATLALVGRMDMLITYTGNQITQINITILDS